MTFSLPWEPFPKDDGKGKLGPDPVPTAAYRGAVEAADAYRATRTAVRRDGEVVRLGNRFVRLARYREVAFVALGNAAVSQAFALSHALGDALTQGYVAGPEPLPPEVPFHSIVVPPALPGSSTKSDEVSAATLELAGGLGPTDLLIVALSSGALSALATAPHGVGRGSYAAAISELGSANVEPDALARLVRTTADGAVAGRLAASTPAEVITLLVDRGGSPVLLGGGPTAALRHEEVERARATLDAVPSNREIGPLRDRLLSRANELPPLPSRVRRPVVVVDPSEALRGAAQTVVDRGWVARSATLPPGSAERSADAFLKAVESAATEERIGPATRERRGVVVLATTTLGTIDGVDERPALRQFAARAEAGIRRRGTTIAILRTAGTAGDPTAPGGLIIGARPTGVPAPPPGPRPLAMRGGITDVGCLAVALLPGDGG